MQAKVMEPEWAVIHFRLETHNTNATLLSNNHNVLCSHHFHSLYMLLCSRSNWVMWSSADKVGYAIACLDTSSIQFLFCQSTDNYFSTPN